MRSNIIFFISILTTLNIYSQNNSSLYERVKNNDSLREKKVNEYMVKNNLEKSIYYNGKTYILYNIIDNKPIYRSTYNQIGAAVTQTNHLQVGGSLGLDLEGSGITVGVWDEGPAQASHVEFQNSDNSATRITNIDLNSVYGTTEDQNHATHVSGTIGAKGVSPEAQGMATNVSIITYNFNGDTGKMIAAQEDSTYDVFLSNHSYGVYVSQPGGSLLDSWYMGAYDSSAREIDNIASSYPYYLIVQSAGNDGNTNYPDGLYSGYDKLTTDKNAKNNLVVANANATVNPFTLEVDAIVINSSSSQGPTDDLRIKPDITGYGTGVISPTTGDTYSNFSGTSMSAPNVTGSLVLLQEYYKNLNGEIMKAATLRGLVCHTAQDDDSYLGPDPKYGWGILNTKESAELIADDENGDALIEELNLVNNDTYTFDFNVTSGQKLIATICWTDVAGEPVSGADNLNNPTPRLVNDLDIRITKGGNTYYPWSLVYSETAGFSNTNSEDNNVDNVEKIEIEVPEAGNYSLTVSHKGELESHELFGDREQNFSLIISGADFTTLSNSNIDINNNVMVWPNPVNDILNFSYSTYSDSNSIINLYDLNGRVIYNKTKKSVNNIINDNIDISKLSSGLYILSIRHGKSIIRKKIIKN